MTLIRMTGEAQDVFPTFALFCAQNPNLTLGEIYGIRNVR